MDAPVQASTNLDSGMSKKQKVEPVAAEPSIAERLAELRKLNGLTLEELAQRASLTKSYLSKL